MAIIHRSQQLVASLVVLSGVLWSAAPVAHAASDWRPEARAVGLEDADIEQLARDGILVTNRAYKQVFTPYLAGGLPRFVTSDSLLNAYHVLYEESVRRLEQANARKLPEILRFVLRNLDGAEERVRGEPALCAAARERASIVVGVALRLLDDTYEPADEPTRSIIQQEVERIVAAQAKRKPAWLGPPQDNPLGLDYNRYKVRGFYARNETLTRYFRAVAWLQSIPFRVANDEELLSILMLGSCITPERFGGDEAKYRAYRDYFGAYRAFLGAGDDWDLMAAADEVSEARPFDLGAKRQQLMTKARKEGGPQINDQIRFAPADPNVTAEANFRIISAYRLPEAVLFQRTTDMRQFQRQAPNGLELCIALGSAFARDKIDDREKAKLLQMIDESRALFAARSLYGDYLHSLAALLEAPDDKAPAFMKGQAWRAKSCGTALAGWAQLRHTWVLQAKSNAFYGASQTPPKGFVEPQPEFYRRMAALAARTRELLQSAHAFEAGYAEAIDVLTETAALLEKWEKDPDFRQQVPSLRDDSPDGPMRVLAFVLCYQEDTRARLARIRRAIETLKAGQTDASFAGLLTTSCGLNLETHWRSLEQTSRRLEMLARKQLAGTALDKKDEALLNGYGVIIAAIMLYGGNSFLTPRDDAPKVADVFWHYRRGNLHVGIGRPRAMYVLYPWEGKEILCEGAVLPYYEFFHGERLTDAEWKGLLDSNACPDVPSWLRPIIWRDGLSAQGLGTAARGQPAGRTR